MTPRRFPSLPPRVRTALALVGSVVLAGGLLWLSVRNADLGRLRETLVEANWWWIVPIAAVTIAFQLLDPVYRAGVIGVAIWFVVLILYFAIYARHRMIRSPEEEFAISGRHTE